MVHLLQHAYRKDTFQNGIYVILHFNLLVLSIFATKFSSSVLFTFYSTHALITMSSDEICIYWVSTGMFVLEQIKSVCLASQAGGYDEVMSLLLENRTDRSLRLTLTGRYSSPGLPHLPSLTQEWERSLCSGTMQSPPECLSWAH